MLILKEGILMNNKISKLAAVVVMTNILATSAAAEGDFGIGVSATGNNATTIRAEVKLEPNLRLEPFFGFTYVDDGISKTNLSIGTAAHIYGSVSEKISMYYGGFVGIGYTKEDTGTASASNTNFNFGPVAGVEYALDPKFSVGTEVGVTLGFGDVTTFGTSTSVLLRYYF